ncbi:MAG: SpoIIE family protein phosphatase [Gammaproteobacteria bacterium]|nr:SpoIIE family protein phosphatase [Gammaproteobacteria bacterium]
MKNKPDKLRPCLLIADDDAASRLMLKAILEQEGYRVVAVEDGKEAVEAYQQIHPDMILLDVMMPVMDGHEAARRIKRLMGDRFEPILFLTATDKETSLVACIDAGGDDFVTKPYSRVLLKAKIDSLLRMRALYSTVLTQRDELEYHRVSMAQEHDTACAIFDNIVGTAVRDYVGVQVKLTPSAQFSGDVVLSARSPIGALYLLLGDFTGHGLTAAVGTVPVAEIFHSMVQKGFSMSNILSEVNQKLAGMLPTGLFCAAGAVVVEPSGNQLMIWNGGLPDAFIYNQNKGGIRYRIPSSHLPLSVLPSDSMNSHMTMIDIEQGDRLYLYSDGVIEANNTAGEMFGSARLLACMNDSAQDSCFDGINDALNQFLGDEVADDDVTLVEVDLDVQREFKQDENYKAQASKRTASWRFSINLDVNVIRQTDITPLVLQAISELQGLQDFRGQLSIILGELINNSIDYGVLAMDSGMRDTADGYMQYYTLREERMNALGFGAIQIDCEHTPADSGDGGELRVRIEDSGAGFDSILLSKHAADSPAFHGRGVYLVRSLVKSLEYQSGGKVVEFVYQWSNG